MGLPLQTNSRLIAPICELLSFYRLDMNFCLAVYQSINQSKRIYIAPYVAGESEASVGLG